MPHTDTIRVHTSARYRGLPVTVAGDDLTRLAAVAGYGTPHEIGRHHGQPRHAPRALPRRGRPPTRQDHPRRRGKLAAERCESFDRGELA